MEEVDYTDLSSCISHNPKISKFEKAVNLSKMMFSFSKKQVHIINMSAAIVQSFRLIAQKLWEELIIQTFLKTSVLTFVLLLGCYIVIFLPNNRPKYPTIHLILRYFY